MSLYLVPVSQREAKEFCAAWHRHHKPPRGDVFRVGAAADGILHAIAIGGRPVARSFDDGQTIEVTRVASDGYRNACSMLYAACSRAAFALGYTRVITYTQEGESGASLRAAGWHVVAERKPRPGWNMPSRPRELHGTENVARTLWEAA